MTTHPKVDDFLKKEKKWQRELTKLRAIAIDGGLTEEFKWYHPCYTFQGSNLLVLGGFKEYCAIMFFKGVLLRDPKRILIQPGENSQSSRQARFTSLGEITAQESILKSYIREAIDAEKAGLKVKLKKTSDYKVPEEFKKKLDQNRALKSAFDSLTPGRQRGYLLYFSSAKQSQTREARVEKNLKRILAGKGLDD